jgi:hypothetical protein
VKYRNTFIVIFILTTAVLFVFGLAAPKLLISSGLEGFTRNESHAGARAIDAAKFGCLNHPLSAFSALRIRVVSVQPSPRDDQDHRDSLIGNYRAELQTYTFFGIPLHKIVVEQDTVTCGT